MLFVASPIWYGMNDLAFVPLSDLCKKHRISFFDYSNDENFVHYDNMFKDGNYLNAFGADEFANKLNVRMRENND